MARIWRVPAAVAAAIVFVVLASPAGMAATIEVSDAWTRATPGSSSSAAVYFTLTNAGKEADRLMSAETPAAGSAELHETAMVGGIMHMGPSKAVDIPVGGKVDFAPNGRHLMLMDLKKPLHKGDEIAVTLHFERAGVIGTKVPVLDVAAVGLHSH